MLKHWDSVHVRVASSNLVNRYINHRVTHIPQRQCHPRHHEACGVVIIHGRRPHGEVKPKITPSVLRFKHCVRWTHIVDDTTALQCTILLILL